MAYAANFDALEIPPGFDLVERPFVDHRYSGYSVTPDTTRVGGWLVVRDAGYDDAWEPTFTIVTFHDRFSDACQFVSITTNPCVRWAD